MTGPGLAAFGVRVAGVALLLPAQEPCEFVALAQVYPLPRAGPRVLGLTQLRGQPIVVLDARARAQAGPPRIGRHPVLVLGVAPEGGAVLVDAAPEPVRVGAAIHGARPPVCAFEVALDGAVADAVIDGQLWWRFDARRLFETLARSQ